MKHIKTIKELTIEQRVRWVQRNKPRLMGTRRDMSLEEWLDMVGAQKYRTCSYPIKEDYGYPYAPVNSEYHLNIKWECENHHPNHAMNLQWRYRHKAYFADTEAAVQRVEDMIDPSYYP